MMLSMMAIGVSAASTPHTAAISLSATTGKAGDTITISVTLDSTTNISALGYKLKYDPNMFEANTTMAGSGANKYPTCYDGTWFNDARLGNIVLFSYLGKPTLGVDTTNGLLTVTGSSSDGVAAEDNEIDCLIGKFYLTVKEGATGSSQISLVETKTADVGETLGVAINFNPVTFTVEGGEPVKSSNADLASLTLSDGTLTPAFAANVTSYTASVANNITSVTINATAADSKATVDGAGTKSLSVGSNTFDIVVTAEDGTTKTYTIVITREEPVLSSDANLTSLTASPAVLSPAFDSATTSYSATVANNVSEVTIAATTSHVSASASGTGTKSLSVGVNTFNVVVTAENGTTKTYTITITRESPTSTPAIALSAPSGSFKAGIQFLFL